MSTSFALQSGITDSYDKDSRLRTNIYNNTYVNKY